MFFSNVSIAEKYNYLEEKFTCAYKWLAETDINALPAGSYPIMGDTVVANIQNILQFRQIQVFLKPMKNTLIFSMLQREKSSSVSAREMALK